MSPSASSSSVAAVDYEQLFRQLRPLYLVSSSSPRIQQQQEEDEDHKDRLETFTQAYRLVSRQGGEDRHQLNKFAFLSKRELSRLKDGFRPLSHEEDTQVRLSNTRRKLLSEDTLPTHISWLHVLTDVKEQGLCGGCWSFAATGLVEAHFAIRSAGQVVIALSEQELLDCDRSKNTGCAGGNYFHSLNEYIAPQGITTGMLYPYASFAGNCKSSEDQKVLKISQDIAFVERTEYAMMEALQFGPVAIALSAYNPTFQYYSSGILQAGNAFRRPVQVFNSSYKRSVVHCENMDNIPDNDTCARWQAVFKSFQSTVSFSQESMSENDVGCGTRVDHAALLVGYGEQDNKKFWLVKNSWGSAWGELGYIRLVRGDASVLQRTQGLGMCGIMTQANTISPSTGNTNPSCVRDDANCSEFANMQFCRLGLGCGLNDTNHIGPGGFMPLDSSPASIGFLAGLSIAGALLVSIVIAVILLLKERRSQRRTSSYDKDVVQDSSSSTGINGNASASSSCSSPVKRSEASFDFSSPKSGAKVLSEDDVESPSPHQTGRLGRSARAILDRCDSPPSRRATATVSTESDADDDVEGLHSSSFSQRRDAASHSPTRMRPSSPLRLSSPARASPIRLNNTQLDDELILNELRQEVLPNLQRTGCGSALTDEELLHVFNVRAGRSMNRTVNILLDLAMVTNSDDSELLL